MRGGLDRKGRKVAPKGWVGSYFPRGGVEWFLRAGGQLERQPAAPSVSRTPYRAMAQTSLPTADAAPGARVAGVRARRFDALWAARRGDDTAALLALRAAGAARYGRRRAQEGHVLVHHLHRQIEGTARNGVIEWRDCPALGPKGGWRGVWPGAGCPVSPSSRAVVRSSIVSGCHDVRVIAAGLRMI